MPRYIAKASITHGQGRDDKRQTWNIGKGQTFDPAEMEMTPAQVERLVNSKMAALHEGGEGSRATPVATPVVINPRTGMPSGPTATTGRQPSDGPDPKSSVGVRQEGSTQAGKATPTGGSTQGGKAPS